MRQLSIILAVVGLCLLTPSSSQAKKGPAGDEVLAQYLYTVADDFIVDVYYNGERVPDAKRHVLLERFGATVERIDVAVRSGDWLVFNVVNNRLRWGGAYYFAAAGMKPDETTIGFTTELSSGQWSCCDNPSNVSRFVSDRDFLASHAAQRVARPWHEGDEHMKGHAKGWSGVPLWGTSRNTWIKFVAR